MLEDKDLLKIAELIAARPAPAVAHVPVRASIAPGQNISDVVTKIATGLLTAGVAGLIAMTMASNETQIRQGEQIATIRSDMLDVKQQTSDRFTRQDFMAEMAVVRGEIDRNTQRLDRRSDIITDTSTRLSALEQKFEHNHERKD